MNTITQSVRPIWAMTAPATWSVVPIRAVLRERNEKNNKLEETNILSVMKDVGVIRYEDKGNVGNKSSDRPEAYKIVRPNDLVLNSMNLSIGSVGISRENGVTSSVYIIYRTVPSLADPDFFNYLFQTRAFQRHLASYGRGIMELREAVKERDIRNQPVVLPSIKIQNDIASFLDKKTKIIDDLISKKERMIELLREQRSVVINHAVTNVKGATEKLKYMVLERRVKLGMVPDNTRYIGLEHIVSGTGEILDNSEKSETESSVNVFKKGDVLFGKLRPYLAKVFDAEYDGVCSGEFLTLTPTKNKVTSKYLFYKLISRNFIKAIDDSTYGTKMPRANWQFIGNQIITYPSLVEQVEIVKMLDLKCAIFKRLIEKTSDSIEKLQLYKSTLIYSAVTGKIKI